LDGVATNADTTTPDIGSECDSTAFAFRCAADPDESEDDVMRRNNAH